MMKAVLTMFGNDYKIDLHKIRGRSLGEFDKYLNELGIEHYYSYPRTPKTNANVERVIRTIEEELWFIEGTDYPIDYLNTLLKKYLDKYNFVRPHCALGYRTPREVAYIDKVYEVGVTV